MTLQKGMKVVIGQCKYRGPCEIDDKIIPKVLKEKIEKKSFSGKQKEKIMPGNSAGTRKV